MGKDLRFNWQRKRWPCRGVGGANRSLVGTYFAQRRSDFIVCTGIGDGAVDVGHYDLPVDD